MEVEFWQTQYFNQKEQLEELQKKYDEFKANYDLFKVEYDKFKVVHERYEKALKEIASEPFGDTSCNEIAIKYEVMADKAICGD